MAVNKGIRYLLTTGYSTDKIEEYISDLFRLYLITNPMDIPNSYIGFEFNLKNTRKDELMNVIRDKLSNLVNKFSKSYDNLSISITKIDILDESNIKITVDINNKSINTYNIPI